MAQISTLRFTVPVADDDWFLSQDMTSGGTATSFSHALPQFPGKIALSHNSGATVSITVVYYRADLGGSYTEAISVATSDVAYTTYAVAKLVSVTWPSTAYTLKVGYQETAYFFAPGLSETKLEGDEVGACFHQQVLDNSGDKATGASYAVAIGTAPAANTIGYDNTSQCLYYNYPTDTHPMAGELVVWARL